MSVDKSEADIREEFKAKVSLMPPELVARYVPLIKAYHRRLMIFNAAMGNMVMPYNNVIEGIVRELIKDHPYNPAKENHSVWSEKIDQSSLQIFDVLHPGVRVQRMSEIEKLAEGIEELDSAFNVSKFVADGGTPEQLQDLEQAVLCRVFSRPEGPESQASLPSGPQP